MNWKLKSNYKEIICGHATPSWARHDRGWHRAHRAELAFFKSKAIKAEIHKVIRDRKDPNSEYRLSLPAGVTPPDFAARRAAMKAVRLQQVRRGR